MIEDEPRRCRQCKNPARPGRKTCAACAQINVNRMRQRRIENKGKCQKCCARLPIPGQKQCETCVAYMRERRITALKAGLCAQCVDAPVAVRDGKAMTYCEACLVNLRARGKRFVENRKKKLADVSP